MRKSQLFQSKSSESCPQCTGELVIRSGAHGLFLGCSNYPECDFIRPLKQSSEESIIKVLDEKHCPVCQSALVLRQGRYGMFIGCINYPECQHVESSHSNNETHVSCPQCKDGQLLQRTSRYGKTFYACNNYPECQFALNYRPVEGSCPQCQYPLLIEKKTAQGLRLFCASKRCSKVIDKS